MGFQRIVPAPYESAKLLGLSLGPLHSNAVDVGGLKQWVDALANCIDYSFVVPDDGSVITFQDIFVEDMQLFCVYIASCDGAVSDAEIAGINQLLGEENAVDRDYADYLVGYLRDSSWAERYPTSFQMLVNQLAGSQEDVLSAAQAAFFFRRVARFICEIDEGVDYEKDAPVSEYIQAFLKYVERVSEVGFVPPDDELTIRDTCAAWDRFVEDENDRSQRAVCGTWRGISGEALGNGLSDFVLKEGGKGFMIKKRLIGKSQVDVEWEVVDKFGPTLMIHIADMDTDVAIALPDDGGELASGESAMAIVSSGIAKLNRTMALYRRV